MPQRKKIRIAPERCERMKRIMGCVRRIKKFWLLASSKYIPIIIIRRGILKQGEWYHFELDYKEPEIYQDVKISLYNKDGTLIREYHLPYDAPKEEDNG